MERGSGTFSKSCWGGTFLSLHGQDRLEVTQLWLYQIEVFLFLKVT